MGTVLTVLLVRFAVVVGGLVVLALLVFAAALLLRRSGRGSQARRWAEPAARATALWLEGRNRGPGRRSNVSHVALQSAARFLHGSRGDTRGTERDR